MSDTDVYHRALGSPTRRQVLAHVTAAGEPIDAQSVAVALHLHVTTVRYHLEQLHDAGLVRRLHDTRRRRGRPRTLYVADTGGAGAKDQLIAVLAAALGGTERGSERARAAGRDWARAFAPDPDADLDADTDADAGAGADASESIERLVEVLERLDFSPEPEPEPEPASRSIVLRSCPFLESARRHPDVVCSAHSGLVEQMLPPGSAGRLLPFARHDACVIALE